MPAPVEILAAIDTLNPQVVTDLTDKLMNYLPNLAMALVVLLVGWWLARRVKTLLKRIFTARHVEPTLAAFLAELTYWLLIVMVVTTALGVAEFQNTSIVAVLGASTLAVGLALQNSLSNFAAGVMIILFRHFRVGDSIEAGGVAGVVEKISIFDTILVTPDNRKIIVPNGKILGSPIVNASAKPTRRLEVIFNISYESDLKQAKDLILAALKEDARALPSPAPEVVVANLGESSVDLLMRVWVNVGDYLDLRSHLLEMVKLRFDAAGIVIPYPQRDVHLRPKA